jgi:hypothetical protein
MFESLNTPPSPEVATGTVSVLRNTEMPFMFRPKTFRVMPFKVMFIEEGVVAAKSCAMVWPTFPKFGRKRRNNRRARLGGCSSHTNGVNHVFAAPSLVVLRPFESVTIAPLKGTVLAESP